MLCEKCNKSGQEQYGTIYESQKCRKCGELVNSNFDSMK